MASNLEHSVDYPFSTQRLWEVMSQEQYWRDLLAAINGTHGSFGSFSREGDSVSVELIQGVAAKYLPSIVAKLRSGDLELPRTFTFQKVGENIEGTIKVTVNGAPAEISGTMTISGDPATARYDCRGEVRVPLVGGKIEKVALEQVTKLLNSERDETINWEQTNR